MIKCCLDDDVINVPPQVPSLVQKNSTLTYEELFERYDLDEHGILFYKGTQEPVPREEKNVELLNKALLYHIQQHLLKKKMNMQEVWIPNTAKPTENHSGQCNIFLSDDFYTNNDTIMVLIQGNGPVRAGQWSTGLCLSSLEEGSMLAYLRKAKKLGYASIILNPNFNHDIETLKQIPGSEDQIKHLITVWKGFISRTIARNIVIVAHSYGGHCICHFLTSDMARDEKMRCNHIVAVAFTDSVHCRAGSFKFVKTVKKVMSENAINWRASYLPLDNYIGLDSSGITSKSSGHKGHSESNYSCIESVFELFQRSTR
jgi:hypothetical protein